LNYDTSQGSLRVPITPMVRKIMVLNAGIYAVCVGACALKYSESIQWLTNNLYLNPDAVIDGSSVWMLATYAWFHEIGQAPVLDLVVCAGVIYGFMRLYKSPWARQEPIMFWVVAFLAMMLIGGIGFGAPLHLAGNLIGLYFFGHIFERRWGPRRFLIFWLLCTIAGGALETLVHVYWSRGIVLGASAGVLGLLAAFSVYHPDDRVLYGMVLPIKGRHFILIAVAFDLLSFLGNQGVAIFAHLGGILMGLLLTTGYWRPGKVLDKLQGGEKRRRANHLRIVPREDDDDPPPYLH
jgi:hypothetical protein